MRSSIIATLIVILSTSLASEAVAQTAQQLRIRWDADVSGPPEVEPGGAPSSPLFTVLERRFITAGVARQRNPELSSYQLLVRALNARGVLIDSQLVPDPRIIRSESAGPTGELSGQVLHHAASELLLTIPNDPAIAEIRFYHPRWTGVAFALDLIGSVALN